MTPEERGRQLASRPPSLREPIERKISEYLSLSPEERELRLHATELRHYLLQLMRAPATNHAALLSQISEPMRSALESRLQAWTLLPPPLRQEVLSSEQAVRYFTQPGVSTEAQRDALLRSLPPDQRTRMEAEIARFQAMPEGARRRMLAQFNRIFELSPAERERALRSLSGAERKAMEETLKSFASLTPDKRRDCIRSFGKFAGMGLVERQQFLINAEEWRKMDPSDRQRWRSLVARVPHLPPLPSGIFPGAAKTNAPPLPPSPTRAVRGLATNADSEARP